MFPDWTRIYKNPKDSGGGRFINAFATFMNQLHNVVDDLLHIESLSTTPFEYEGLNISNIDYVSKVEISSAIIESSKKIEYEDNGVRSSVTFVSGAYQLFANDKPSCYYDTNDQVLYVNKIIDGIKIDDIDYTAKMHHIWGPYDEIGLLIGCPRQPFERNKDYVYRLRETYRQFANSSDQKLRNYLYRTLIPFTSQLPKDIIEFVELSPDFVEKHMLDGQPDQVLEKYFTLAREINQNTDNSYWDIVEQRNLGIKMLPISWSLSSTNIDDKLIQNGVLRPTDLEISKPMLAERNDKIDYIMRARKQSNKEIETYPETPFEYSLVHQEEQEDGTENGEVLTQETSFRVTAYEKLNLEFDIDANAQYTNVGTTTFGVEEINGERGISITHTNNQDVTKTLVSELIEGSEINGIDEERDCEILDGTKVHVKDADSDTAHVIINLKSDEAGINAVKFFSLDVYAGEETPIKFSAEEIFNNAISKYNVYLEDNVIKLAKEKLYVQHNTENIFNQGDYTNTSYVPGKGIGLNLFKKE